MPKVHECGCNCYGSSACAHGRTRRVEACPMRRGPAITKRTSLSAGCESDAARTVQGVGLQRGAQAVSLRVSHLGSRDSHPAKDPRPQTSEPRPCGRKGLDARTFEVSTDKSLSVAHGQGTRGPHIQGLKGTKGPKSTRRCRVEGPEESVPQESRTLLSVKRLSRTPPPRGARIAGTDHG